MAGTTFTNKRLSYHVSNTTGTITLEGDATINSQSLIDSFNGSVNSTTGQYGNFSYSESDGGTSKQKLQRLKGNRSRGL